MSVSRKRFLQTLGVSALAAATPGAMAVAESRKQAKSGVRITDVKAYAPDSATYVKIETDAGISGWGEGDHESPRINAMIVKEILKPVLIGQDPFDSAHLWTHMFFGGFEGGSSGFVPGAVAGVDNALWDLKGRLLNMPVSKLMGASKLEKVAVYGSYGRKKGKGFKTIDEMVSEGMAFVEQGYKTIKARMQLYDRGRNPAPDTTFACVKAIRKAVGDDIDLFVDFNNGYTAGKAIALGLKLYEHCHIKVVEEPVSSMDYPGLRQVVEALPCDVNAGEHEYNKWQFRDLITIGNPDCLNLDVIKCAGLTECYKVAAMGHAFEKEVMVHNTRPTLATAASLNLLGAIPNAAKVQEFSGMRPELNLHQFFHNALKFENGFLFIPTEPGLGLQVNEKAMEKFLIR